jgi:hypothetical protein
VVEKLHGLRLTRAAEIVETAVEEVVMGWTPPRRHRCAKVAR